MKYRIAITLILFTLLLPGCRNLLGDGTGTLTIVIGSGSSGAARTIGSALDTTIAGYQIIGTDGVSDFSRSVGAGLTTITQESLISGVWTISAEALNTGGQTVLSGGTSVLVEAGGTATAQVVLSPPAGDGVFSFVLTWPPGEVESPATTATVLPQAGGSATPLDFSIDAVAGSASFTGELPAGFYEFTIFLRDAAVIVWPGATWALHVRAGATSVDSLALTSADLSAPGTGPGNATPGDLIWSFTAGSAFSSSIWSSPAISGDRVYVGSDTGRLYALDLATGNEVWNYLTAARITSSPAVGADGTIYVGSHDGNLYALNPNGTARWPAFATGGWVRSSPAIGADGTVYVGSNDGNLYAINGTTGVSAWAAPFSAGSQVTSSPALGADGTIYFGTYGGNVYAVWPDGSQRWVFTGAADWVHSSPAIGEDGTVYVGSYDGFLYALDGATGNQVWASPYDAGDWIGSSAVIAGGNVLVGSRGGTLHAVNAATGAFAWSFDAGTGGVYSTPAVGDNGTIYFGSYDRNIYALDASGNPLWSYQTGLGGVSSSPVIDSDGVIYVGSRDGNLYALGSSAGGPAASPWPMFGRNSGRTARVD